MSNKPIDLRSDTVTQPTPEMRRAISDAEVGDDVFRDDPTVERLQKWTADLLGKEEAIYMPSGTMTNQVAIRIHCKPGDEFLCEAGCHIFNYEQGAFAQLSGVVAHTVEGESGVLELDQLSGLIRAENEHLVRTRLVSLENTHNRGGGRIQPYENVEQICSWARDHGLRTHLDGARLFNAVIATGIDAAEWARHFDTVSVCYSKGLGAPVGSALVGSRELIDEARRHRKAFGGGMRQAGIIAAGALFALKNNIQRLAQDHDNAQILAETIRVTEGLKLRRGEVDTNIVIFHVDSSLGSAAQFVEGMRQKGVSALALGSAIVRAVTHLHISEDDARQAADVIQQVARGLASGELKLVGNAETY